MRKTAGGLIRRANRASFGGVNEPHLEASRAELLAQIRKLQEALRGQSQDQAGRSHADAQSALRDSEERLRAILETSVEAIITIDERGIIESFNPAAEKIFGYQAEEVIGRNVSLLMPSPFRKEHNRYIANYLRTGQAKIIGIGREIAGQRKDLTIFPIDLAVSEVRLAHRRLFTGFIRDITERKRLEREILQISEQEQRRIGQDLHDGLCQHLAGIEMLSQLLEQKLDAKGLPEAAGAAEIAKLVRQAISHTRDLSHGLSPVLLEPEGLMSALSELASGTETLFRVTCVFECPVPVLVHSNTVATHLYRIAQEAISNAVKHGKAKKIKIRMTQPDRRIELSIKDDGMGMAIQRSTGHSGMGLRIMNYRAGMIGGSLAIESEPGKGTQVTCSVEAGLQSV